MSRQNKVNPGMYTQRGRLAQDDIARELARQRATGSPQPWPPEPHHPFQSREALKPDEGVDGDESREPAEQVKTKRKPAAGKRKTVKARTVKAKTVKARTVKAKSVRRATSAKRARPRAVTEKDNRKKKRTSGNR